MIKGILDIGRQVLASGSREEFLRSLALDVRPVRDKERKLRQQYIVNLDFVTGPSPTIKVTPKAIGNETPNTYLWVGNAYGASDPDRATTNGLEYLLRALPTLASEVQSSSLKPRLQEVVAAFYVDGVLNTDLPFLADVKKRLGDRKAAAEEKAKKAKGKPRKTKKPTKSKDESVEVVEEYIAQELAKAGSKATEVDAPGKGQLKDVVLFTAGVNSRLLCEASEYQEYLERRLVTDRFSSGRSGICHLCASRNTLLWDTSGFQPQSLLKLHVTDKLGFASGLAEKPGFAKNFAMCESCYRALLAGNAFIRRKLRTGLAGTTVFLVPSIHVSSAIPVRRLDDWGDYLKGKFGAVSSYGGWEAFRAKLQEYADYEGASGGFTLNFVFGAATNAAFKVKKVIQDVPPSHLDEMLKQAADVSELGGRLLRESRPWHINLGTIARLIPVPKAKKGNRQVVMSQPVIALLSSIIGGQSVDYGSLLPWFAELARVYRFEKFSPLTTIPKPGDGYEDIEFSRATLQCNLLLEYLRRLKLLKGEEGMTANLDNLKLREDAANFLREMKYDEPKAGLFLLGCLVGEVASAQYSKGAKNKPILNKLNFQAMGLPKLQRLSNDVFERMQQLKLLFAENEKTFGAAKMLLDKHAENWPLTQQENVFYVLSGYAYVTHKMITSGGPKAIDKSVEEPKQEETDEQDAEE